MGERSKRILKVIKDSGLSYGELSKATNIPKSALQRYATGQTEKIPIDRLELIADATQADLNYLMCWDTEPDEKEIADNMSLILHNSKINELLNKMKKMNSLSLRRLSRYADLLLEEEQGND